MKRLLNTVVPGVIVTALLVIAFVVNPGSGGVDVEVTAARRCATQPAPACERPYATRVEVVETGSGDLAAAGRTPASGRLRLPLDPGRYLLRAAPPPGRRARAVRVFVRSGHYTVARVRYRLGRARAAGTARPRR